MAKRLMRVPHVQRLRIRIPKACQMLHSVQVVCHHFNIYAGSCVALALWCRDGHH